MNNFKYKKIINLESLRSFVLALLIVPFLLAPLSAQAFFGDRESSFENIFGASSLGIDLELTNQTADSRDTTVTADLAEDVEYRLVNASSTGAFCADLQVEIIRGGNTVYTGALSTFSETATSSLASSDSEDWEFEFSVLNTAVPYMEDCAIDFDYIANQVGYGDNEAFNDVERDSFVLLG
ncbi:MAG: hypothetical protein WD605_01945, partial [Candidatus Paceibacterota bacterium]